MKRLLTRTIAVCPDWAKGNALELRNCILAGVVLCFLAAGQPLEAADFGWSAIIRAGLPNAGDWELGMGPLGNNTATSAHLSPYYANNIYQNFQIGYRSATQTAFLRFYNGPGTAYTEITRPIGFAVSPSAIITWEIPASAFYLSASSRPAPTAVAVDQLSLSGTALTVLQPLAMTAWSASQNRSNMVAPIGAPVVFQTAGGDWTLSGRIRFQGLQTYQSPGAQRSQLHMGFSINGTVETPEPATWTLTAASLALLGLWRRRRRGSS